MFDVEKCVCVDFIIDIGILLVVICDCVVEVVVCILVCEG